MPKYSLVATVERMVTDTIQMTVEAEDECRAYVIAGEVARKFPEPHSVDGVKFCYIERRNYHEPEFVDIKDQEDEGVG